jgi:hypothetical protein
MKKKNDIPDAINDDKLPGLFCSICFMNHTIFKGKIMEYQNAPF